MQDTRASGHGTLCRPRKLMRSGNVWQGWIPLQGDPKRRSHEIVKVKPKLWQRHQSVRNVRCLLRRATCMEGSQPKRGAACSTDNIAGGVGLSKVPGGQRMQIQKCRICYFPGLPLGSLRCGHSSLCHHSSFVE